MSPLRHQRKSCRAGSYRRAVLALAISVQMLCGGMASAGVNTTERVVIDWRSGLAINGYDPVAYFVDGVPRQGRPAFEYVYAEATWQFRNIGNRDAFAAHPEVYMPQFGGYDPVHAGQGRAVAGNPMLWLILSNRLYLFYDAHTRANFAADPYRYLEAAKRKWPGILRSLVP